MDCDTEDVVVVKTEPGTLKFPLFSLQVFRMEVHFSFELLFWKDDEVSDSYNSSDESSSYTESDSEDENNVEDNWDDSWFDDSVLERKPRIKQEPLDLLPSNETRSSSGNVSNVFLFFLSQWNNCILYILAYSKHIEPEGMESTKELIAFHQKAQKEQEDDLVTEVLFAQVFTLHQEAQKDEDLVIEVLFEEAVTLINLTDLQAQDIQATGVVIIPPENEMTG